MASSAVALACAVPLAPIAIEPAPVDWTVSPMAMARAPDALVPVPIAMEAWSPALALMPAATENSPAALALVPIAVAPPRVPAATAPLPTAVPFTAETVAEAPRATEDGALVICAFVPMAMPLVEGGVYAKRRTPEFPAMAMLPSAAAPTWLPRAVALTPEATLP